jgi:hypothetical protein
MSSNQRISVIGNQINIKQVSSFEKKAEKLDIIIPFDGQTSAIQVSEDDVLCRIYKIDQLKDNPDLTGQFLHCSIRLQANGAVMIDGIISKKKENFSTQSPEAIRLQPFFLKACEEENIALMGKGLVARGLHFAGHVTPSNVRSVCICDYCKRSFTLRHFHAGFSDSQYFYSGDSLQTLIVPWYKIKNMPVQTQEKIDVTLLPEVESQLPKPTKGQGDYKYYNPFRCPHCAKPFIDFEKFPEIRPYEYYGYNLINAESQLM